MTQFPASSDEIDLPVGTVIGERYQIQGVLGRGGFATVYKAKQLNIEQAVAIKLLRTPTNVAPGFIERFVREAKAAAQIHHPDIVRVMDYGVHSDGRPYIAMELLRGHALSVELERSGALDAKRALRLFVRCLDALQAAHELSIVHRDLKPDNIFVTDPNSRVEALHLLDFGIAHVMDQNVRLTNPGEFYGTPEYLTPEYIRSKTISPALDVYQMGLIFVEAVSGSPAVVGTGMQCMMRHSRGELDIPDSVRDSPLGPVLERALALDHTQRYQSAGAFRDALEAVEAQAIAHFGTRPAFIEVSTDVDSLDERKPGIPAMLGQPILSGMLPQVFRGGAAASMSPSGAFPHLEREGDPDAGGPLPSTVPVSNPAVGQGISIPSPSGQLRPILNEDLRSKMGNEVAATVVDFSPDKKARNPARVSATIVDFKPPSALEEAPPEDKPQRPRTVMMDSVERVGRGMTMTQKSDAVASDAPDLRSRPQLQKTVTLDRPSEEDRPEPDPLPPQRPPPSSALPTAGPPTGQVSSPSPSTQEAAKASGKRHLFLMLLLGVCLMLIVGMVLVLLLITTGIIGGGEDGKASEQTIEAPAEKDATGSLKAPGE